MYLYHEEIFVKYTRSFLMKFMIMQILCRTLPEQFILSVCLLLLSPICKAAE
jgi:hypothetical protein